MRRKKEINIFNISFLDLISGALGAVIILFIAVPKNHAPKEIKKEPTVSKCLNQNNHEESLNKCEKELFVAKSKIENLNAKYQKLENQKETFKKKEIIKPTKTSNNDREFKKQVGFNFKGKNIVFLIDISGSMSGDKIGQVKAGLKMLIASMDESFHIDVVYFPHAKDNPYYALWSMTQPLQSLSVKEEIYNFLNRLRPRGGTPTMAALSFALTNYKNLSDIVLLSDGAPGDGTKDEILKMVKLNNHSNVQINTIGVGKKNFLSNSDFYEFLKELSGSTKGFNYGF